MRAKKGRAKKGKTPIIEVAYLRSKNISICGVYSKYGMDYYENTIGGYNGNKFKNFVFKVE